MNFNLTEAEFWKLTPAKFFSLVERVQEKEQRDDFRFGVVLSNLLAWFSRSQKDPFEFFGWVQKRTQGAGGLREFLLRKVEESKERKKGG